MTDVLAGRYELRREIGRGGMGAVWLGRDLTLGRDVALKQIGLLPGADRADLERVEREARVSAMLHHEHVVSVFDLVTDGDRHWLVMEYLESTNLADVIRRRGPLSPDETASILGQAASALAAAHQAGIVHRDVKPSNILVTSDGRAKLGDFGIARTTTDATLTQTGMVTGSPGYLAPEVAAGHAATSASDVWSLGATVFHAVAGHPPYDTGGNLIGALYRIVHEDPPRTDRAGWLDPLLRATMHRDPGGRWSAGEAAAFLARAHEAAGATEAPVASAPPLLVDEPAAPLVATTQDLDERMHVLTAHTSAEPSSRWGSLTIGAAVALVASIALGGWLLARGDDGRTPPGSERNVVQQPSPTATAEGMREFVEGYLDTVIRDPQSAWEQLTPGFQRASGSYEQYVGFWGDFEAAEVSGIQADPEDLTVSYHVEYSYEDGRPPFVDDVSLELTFDGTRYLIAYERG